MIIASGTSFAGSGDWTPVAGDAMFSEDGAAFVSTGCAVTWSGCGIWGLNISASELSGSITSIIISDTAIEDQALIIQTWGDDTAGIPINAWADFILRRSFASAVASGRGDSPAENRHLLGVIAHFVNKLYQDAGNLIATEEDDSTAYITRAVTPDAGGDPIAAVDPT